ncbi:erythromycin esterase family protein [Corallococcus macrosporus]|uniref:Erythromycin esterase family protein n=1 Tax=Corallococcus macrosporus TaxID=35 RepID=A0ABS3D575_9BACT|nr:erythromycin esterase family protein [Corallococcus macrosporus]MBN8226819.1 erythromycin esterase family protein [Corallococcus macrosporus]
MKYLLLLLPLLAACASSSQATSPREAVTDTDADRIVRALCDKQLALLGEESHHGNARTVAFKVALTRRLVEECHYDAFVIEAGTYDFLHIQALLKAGQPLGEDTVAAAIGRMWATEEMAPLIPFLTARLQAGTLVAGGLDDQIGRGTYAQKQMARELIPLFQGPRQAACGAEIERHMAWGYDEAHPYTAETAKFILGCWQELASALTAPESGRSLRMVRNLERNFTRQVAAMSQTPEQTASARDWNDFDARDRSMFLNLESFLSQFPRPRKAIVWLATIHAAKDLRQVDADARNGTSFGSHVREKYGDRSFVLGFSANSGGYALGSSARTYVLAPATAESLEGWAFANHAADTRYLEGHQLRDFGPRVARALNYTWMTAPWDTVMDGLLIFREEAPGRPR